MKKKPCDDTCSPEREKKQVFLTRARYVFLCVLMCFTSLSLMAQEKEKKFDVSFENESLETVLTSLKKQCGYDFIYQKEAVAGVKVDRLEMKQATLKQILDKLLLPLGFSYEIVDRSVVIRKNPQKSKETTLQSITIKGKVVDMKKQPLPGVTVLVKGTTLGVSTSAEGTFKIEVPSNDMVLVFSFVGMETKEIKLNELKDERILNGKANLEVVLKETVESLEDVVITGYANIRKESFTGNATTVTRDQLLKTNNKNVIAALQHFDPSFRIKENSLWGSDPNALPEFNIRGESSIAVKGLDVEQAKLTQRTNLQDNPNLPIFILDGFEVSVQKIYDMDMNRIESFTILKDAAATAMYGSRAANGVVVVTTVAPKPGEIRITYNLAGGVELPDLSDYNLCNAEEKLEVERLSGLYTADGEQQIFRDIDYNDKLNLIRRGVDTDWMAKPLRNAFNHKHSLNIQGGVESIRYSLDFSYDSNNGAMKGSHRSRAGAGLTLDYRNKSWLQILNAFSYNTTRSEDSPYGTFSTYTDMQPYLPIYDDNGNLLELISNGSSDVRNPLWAVENLRSYSGKGVIHDFTNNLSVNLFIMEGLQFKGQFSISKQNSKTESFIDPNDNNYKNSEPKEKGSLTRNLTDGYNWNLNAMFYFNKMIKKHFINATLGVNMSESKSETTNVEWNGFQMGTMDKPAFAADQPNKTDVNSTENRLIGLLASINYSLKEIYLLDASFRLDGSSQFGEDKRFAPFWSLGVGMNIHNYEFMKNSWLINTLRVRATYGSTGKVNFPSYTAVTTYRTDRDKWYYTGPATSLIYLGNPNLTWETTKTVDLGFAIGLLEDRFYIDFAYYRKKTEDLIDQVAVRQSSGFENRYTNTGAILNTGFEINTNATVFRNDNLMITLNANLASNKNEIVEVGKEMEEYNKKLKENYEAQYAEYPSLKDTPVIQYYEGASTSAIYAVRSAGIDPTNGKEKFIKKNGTSTYTWCADDQVVVGDNNPSAQGAFGINVGYKGFYFNASFLYQWGGQTYNKTLLDKVENADIRNKNVDKRILSERWKKVGDLVPYYDLQNTTFTQPTSRFVQDYNFLNFSSLSCGYDFKRSLIQKVRLQSLGIRFNANDICRWSSVKEERGTSYPYAKNYSFTLSVGF